MKVELISSDASRVNLINNNPNKFNRTYLLHQEQRVKIQIGLALLTNIQKVMLLSLHKIESNLNNNNPFLPLQFNKTQQNQIPLIYYPNKLSKLHDLLLQFSNFNNKQINNNNFNFNLITNLHLLIQHFNLLNHFKIPHNKVSNFKQPNNKIFNNQSQIIIKINFLHFYFPNNNLLIIII